jgi:hypothetical protein
MNADDATSVYYQLLDILRQSEMNWIIDQVNEVLLLGKPQAKKVKPFREQFTRGQRTEVLYPQPDMLTTLGQPVPTGPATELTATLAYTPQERLILLIDAIEQAVTESAVMEQRAVQTLEEIGSNQQIRGITFVSEQENGESRFVSQREIRSRTSAASQLQQLLVQIREEVRDHQ